MKKSIILATILTIFSNTKISFAQNISTPKNVKDRKFEVYSNLDSYRKIDVYQVNYLDITYNSDIYINPKKCEDNVSLVKITGFDKDSYVNVLDMSFILDENDNLLSAKGKVLHPNSSQWIDFEIFYDSNKFIGYQMEFDVFDIDKRFLNYLLGLYFSVLTHPQVRGFSSCG